MTITEKDIDIYKKALDSYTKARKVIDDRIGEVIKITAKAFHKRIDCWWHPNPRGNFSNCITTPFSNDGYDEICFEVDRNLEGMETDEWDYRSSFPRKFLFMSDEEIISEIKSQIERTKRNAIEEKKKKTKADEEKKKLKAAALKKLSKEERRALDI